MTLRITPRTEKEWQALLTAGLISRDEYCRHYPDDKQCTGNIIRSRAGERVGKLHRAKGPTNV